MKWLDFFYIAIIVAEYNFFNGLASPSNYLAFANLISSKYQSEKVDYNLPIVKPRSKHLKNALIYGSFSLLGRYPVLYDY